jgi:hypothetical protein
MHFAGWGAWTASGLASGWLMGGPAPPEELPAQLPALDLVGELAPGGGPASVAEAAHPLYALATFELSRYRRELEQALASLPSQAPGRCLLQDKLTLVLAEQESRFKITGRSGRRGFRRRRPDPGPLPGRRLIHIHPNQEGWPTASRPASTRPSPCRRPCPAPTQGPV